jgi:glutathione S-transferase
MSAPVLWNHDLDDACYRVRLMASLAGVTLKLRTVDAYPGREHLAPAMLALNPLGRLPVLQDGELTLTQPEAMLCHLARIGPCGAPFLPARAQEAARVQDWLAFAARDLGAASAARAAAMMERPGDPQVLARAARAALRVLEDHMSTQRHMDAGFVAGSAASVADVALFPAFALSRDFGLDHDAFPALRLWARRIRALPGFVTMPGIPDYH